MAEAYNYLGTKNGLPTVFDDSNLATADTGSIYNTVSIADSTSGSMFGGVGDYLGKQKLGDITSTVGLGLGAFNDLFGSGAKQNKQSLENAKKQSTLLSQQIENNAQSMADRKLFNENMAKSSNSAMGLGKVIL